MPPNPEVYRDKGHNLREMPGMLARGVMSIINKDSHPENIVKDVSGWAYPIGHEIHLFRDAADGAQTKYDSVRGTIKRGPYFKDDRIFIDVMPYGSERHRSIALVECDAEGRYVKTKWISID